MIKNISNLGDAALYCDFGDEVSILTSSPKSQYKAASPRFDIFLIMPCYTEE